MGDLPNDLTAARHERGWPRPRGAEALEPSVPIAEGEVVEGLPPEVKDPRRTPEGQAHQRAIFTTATLEEQKRTRRRHLPDIALSGLAGAGKDTAAQALVDAYGYTVGKFAAPLYKAVLALNPYDEHGNRVADRVERQGWEVVKRHQPEVRRLLQVMGTEVGRQMFGEDFWVEQAGRWRQTISGPVVWTDTRFPNEVEFVTGQRVMRHPLSQHGGLWVHIVRPGQVVEGSGHASESSLPPTVEADYQLENSGTPAKLHAGMLAIVQHYQVAADRA